MATAQSKLDIIVQAKNQASPQIRSLSSDLKELDKSAGFAAKGIQGLALAGGIAGVAALGNVAIDTAMALSDQAASMRRVEVAGRSLAGGQENLNALLHAYKDAIGGAVTDGEALARLTSLQAIGFADNAREVERFVTAARGASLATGNEIGYVIGQMQLAIANQSTMRLDQIGLGVSEVKARIDALKSANKELSEEGAYQEAIMSLLIEKYGRVARSAEAGATGVDNLRTALRQAREEMAEHTAQSFDDTANWFADRVNAFTEEVQNNAGRQAASWYGPMIEGIKNAIAAQEEELAVVERQLAAYRELDDGTAAYRLVIAQLEDAQKGLTAELASNRDMAREYAGTLGTLTGENQRAAFETGEMEQKAYAAAQAQREAGDAAQEAAPKIANIGLVAQLAAEQFDLAVARVRSNTRSLQSIASDLVDNLGAAGTQSWLGEQDAMLRLHQQRWKDIEGYSDEYINNVLTPAYIGNLRDGANELDRTRDNALKAATAVPKISEAAKEAQRQFDDLRGKVESVLQAALSHGTGVDPNDVLEKLGIPRPDAINESARRLADIAQNGLKGQDWLGDFASDVPDIWRMIRTAQNPQEEAAYLLRDFQDGLLNAAIDKDKAKEIVKRQIMGDRNMAAMAREIAEELAAEMGVPLQEALKAAQGTLGGGGTSAAGTDAAAGFADGAQVGMEETNAGGSMVDTFISQMRAAYSKLGLAGRDAGTAWGTGFMAAVGENVPPALIDMLVNLVTPGVMAKYAQQGSLTGATP